MEALRDYRIEAWLDHEGLLLPAVPLAEGSMAAVAAKGMRALSQAAIAVSAMFVGLPAADAVMAHGGLSPVNTNQAAYSVGRTDDQTLALKRSTELGAEIRQRRLTLFTSDTSDIDPALIAHIESRLASDKRS